MNFFVVDPEKQREDAEERLRIAVRLLKAALDTHREDPTRENEISLKAATRLVRETKAELEEWTVG